ncbi:MAG: YihY family inner membrane protein [Pseudomonadota bacterium]
MDQTPIKTLSRFVNFTWHNFQQNGGFETAKSLTYTSLFAVVPFITLLLAILSAFPSFQVFGNQIEEMIFTHLLPSSSSELAGYITEFASQARNLTWVGAVMLLVTAYLMLANVEGSFNKIWAVSEQRKGLSSFLLYWSVLSLGPLLLGIAFAISSYITSLDLFARFTAISDYIGALPVFLELFPTALTIGAFTLLYVAVPNSAVRVRDGLIGAVVVAVLFKVVKWGFATFITRASYEFLYGTFAAIPIFLVWIYLCWVVILFGANLVRSIPLFSTHNVAIAVHPCLLLLALMHKFWDLQRQGRSLHLDDLIAEEWPPRAVSVDKLLLLLVELKIVRSINEEEYILIRDLHEVSMWDVLGATPWPLPLASDMTAYLPPVIVKHLPDIEALEKSFRCVEELACTEFSQSINSYFNGMKVHASTQSWLGSL